MVRIEQLYYFLEAVKAGSFTQAAKNLYLQQPSLRNGINNLENELGQPLLERTQRGVTLTAYGQFCLPHIQHMVDTYEMLKQGHRLEDPPRRTLRIEASSVYNITSSMATSDELYRKSAKDRDCRISMNDDKYALINKVIQRECDIGLIVYFREDLKRQKVLMAQKDKAYTLVDLAQYELLVYMRKGHPLARKKILSLEDVCDYLLIFYMVSNPPMLDLLDAEVGRSNIKYTIMSNMKLVNKYCLQEDCLFFVTGRKRMVFDEGMTYRTFAKDYVQYLGAVMGAGDMRDDVLKYIEIVKALLADEDGVY